MLLQTAIALQTPLMEFRLVSLVRLDHCCSCFVPAIGGLQAQTYQGSPTTRQELSRCPTMRGEMKVIS